MQDAIRALKLRTAAGRENVSCFGPCLGALSSIAALNAGQIHMYRSPSWRKDKIKTRIGYRSPYP
eukprot:scaffold9590_cov138-Skeletonema_dohrnii-CCMP3373.AAC.1